MLSLEKGEKSKNHFHWTKWGKYTKKFSKKIEATPPFAKGNLKST